jgi:hypothetical protein
MAPTRRHLLPSVLRELSPELDGPLHVGWQRLRAALRGANVAPGLVSRSFHARLGPSARLCPTEDAVVELLDAYYTREARGQLAEGRFLVVREGERVSARRVVSRLRGIAPELGPLTLCEERGKLLLRTTGAFIEVEPRHIREEHVGSVGWVRRTVSVDTIVAAANRMLRFYGEPYRFLPVASSDDLNAYLAADAGGAALLDRVDLWAEPLEDLGGFAAWPTVSERPSARVA